MKKGLILEGGAMRGLFTAGVLDVLLEHHIEFDGTIGVSAGACFGVNYKSKQIGRTLRYNLTYCQDDRYGSFKSFIKSGNMFDAQFCYYDIPEKYDLFDVETYNHSSMDFIVVATDVNTGRPVYHSLKEAQGPELEWIRASAAVPLVSQIVTIDNYELLDGGIGDSIPVNYMLENGYDRNLVILTQPRNYLKEKNNMMPILQRKYPDKPEFLEAMANRHIRYNQTTEYIKELEENNEIFVIAPVAPLNISATCTDPSEIMRVYQLGRIAANQKIEQLISYLK